jgi:hypothetical protein
MNIYIMEVSYYLNLLLIILEVVIIKIMRINFLMEIINSTFINYFMLIMMLYLPF